MTRLRGRPARPEQKFREIKVLVEETYLVPMIDDTRTAINGESLKQLKVDWFQSYDINSHHATRDSHRVGGGRRVIKVDWMEPE